VRQQGAGIAAERDVYDRRGERQRRDAGAEGEPVAVILGRGCQAAQVARRRTSQTVAAMSSADSASSQPPSIHWKGQNRLAGW
jgi:hypothetical protein